MNFPSINIQGNILSGEILEKIRIEDINHQTTASFGLGKNVKVRDEIGLAWSTMRGLWQTFKIRKERLAPEDSGTTETRNFWMLPFLTTLGYDVEKATAELIDNKTYAISHRAPNLQGFPIHITGINDSLDKRRETGGPRLSPHALVQEYLNKTDDHLYALVTNGRHLRLLRDATRLVRMTYLEFDLEKMMEEELFSDFAILYRVLHASRMPQEKGEGETAIIEQYHQDSLEAGARIREKLSEAVEYAIKHLANGFLQHPGNNDLRQAVSEGAITPSEFYLYSLRLVYRMLFLLVIEDRGLVYPDKLDEEARRRREAYLGFYSLNRLRRMAERKLFIDGGKHDLWENLKVTFSLFENLRLAQKLGLQPLASGIFHPDAISPLSGTRLYNLDLLEVMQRICYFHDQERKLMVKVNYSDLDVEEFGSVYEGLLEYKPVFSEMNGKPVFSFQAGTERSSSGSHYTPEELVRPLIQHSLDYIIDDCLKKPHERLKAEPGSAPLKALQEKALLNIKVADVACGSGHILLSAARRIATELARVRTGEDQPSPSAMRHAIRDTIRHCIYGVDKNPLAVELCKVALWLEAHNPGEPLNFLDHKIKCGDSIVGLAHREELKNGIADEAFKTLAGDDKEVAAGFRSQNKRERMERRVKETQLATEFDQTTTASVQEAIAEYTSFAALPETTPEEITRKEKAYQRFLDGKGHQWLKLMADLQVAQFFIPKTNENKDYLLTDAPYRQVLAGYKGWQNRPAAKASVLAQEKRFFHWFVEFPEIFENGGFDCILGNPPYLGGKKISGAYGTDYLNYLITNYFPAGGQSDFIVYFLKRIFNVVSLKGLLSILTTNTISQGDTREFGLGKILENQGVINFAFPSIKWPGKANLEVTIISICKSCNENLKIFFKNEETTFINSFLETGGNVLTPLQLKVNQNKSFKGSYIGGLGYTLTEREKSELIIKNALNQEVIFPYITGGDLNDDFLQRNSRWVINFFNWQIDKAMSYHECFEIVRKKVKPVRDKANRASNREKWWIYAEDRPGLYNAISSVKRVLGVSQVTKHLIFSFLPKGLVYDTSMIIFPLENNNSIAFLQNSIYDSWARKYGSTLESRLRYTPTDCFETYPFPKNLILHHEQQLEAIGEAYYENRRQLMLSIKLGLTKTYNAFHAPEIQPGITAEELSGFDKKAIEKKYGKELWNLWNHLQRTEGTCILEEAIEGIVKLRELHLQMDQAVLEAYGWDDVLLRHNFYEVDYLPENDRIRFTIHPDERKEVLKRLLELNHQYFEEEARQGLHKEETVRKFYEQKGTPIPEEVSKWFTKGKAYKKPRKSSKANEPQGGYGGLFDNFS